MASMPDDPLQLIQNRGDITYRVANTVCAPGPIEGVIWEREAAHISLSKFYVRR